MACIGKDCTLTLDNYSEHRFGRHFKVDTYVIVPEYRNQWRLEEKMIGVQGDSSAAKRDAFFYYLLVANIVLLVIVGMLVFRPVKTVYFS